MERLKLHASLPSGRYEIVQVCQSGTVADLKKAARESLGQRFLRLAAPNGNLLDDPTEPLELVGLQNGDVISAVAEGPKFKVATARHAFALWCPGSVEECSADSGHRACFCCNLG
eukprot:Skav215525  [mRNA]  locus=scaffold219:163669:164013:+ [translate_table: standard]